MRVCVCVYMCVWVWACVCGGSRLSRPPPGEAPHYITSSYCPHINYTWRENGSIEYSCVTTLLFCEQEQQHNDGNSNCLKFIFPPTAAGWQDLGYTAAG